MKRNASVQTTPPMINQTTINGSAAPPTSIEKNTTLAMASATGATQALTIASTSMRQRRPALPR
jgi:hypothetical protein